MLQKTADTFLDEPIQIAIDIKAQGKWHSFLQRIRVKPKQAVYQVKGCTLRNMIRISRILLEVDFKPAPKDNTIEWGYGLVDSEGERMAEIIAIAIHNRKEARPEYLLDLILDNFSAGELRKVSGIILDRLNVSDFISSIASVRTMNLLASPQEPEIIAEQPIVTSGEQLEGLKNIFDTARLT